MSDEMDRQLVFDLSREPCFDPDDFLVSAANEVAVAAVRSWRDWPGQALLLIGPPGSGKSHLAAIWAEASDAVVVRSSEQLGASLWHANGRRVLLEDCDRGDAFAEPAFFHALNCCRETGGWLLMTAQSAPVHWGLKTPDLLSRLRSAPIVSIEPPDPELMKAVILKLFADRQILIEQDVVSYAARHCEQSLDAANRFVAAVDEIALASGRRITRPLASATLTRLQHHRAGNPNAHGPT